MSLSNINILFDNYKTKDKSKYGNDNSKTPEKKGTDITKKDTNEKSASGIFQMIKKDPSSIKRNESPKKEKQIRKDYKGTVIQKGSKAHRVSFIDQITKINLKEEVFVDSYKEFNIDMSNTNENCSCKCLMI